jgi:MFS family permease
LLSAYVFGRIAFRYGVRPVISYCFFVMAIACMCAGLAGKDLPYAAMAFLLLGALAASGLDGVGGIPYLRAVRPHERSRMTAVYRTFLDLSELIPAIVFSIALEYFEIGVVFKILAIALVLMGGISYRYLPKSM